MSYEVKLDVFEGPFELLLSLIGDRQLDVCDVPIARLTEDYLARLEHMRDLDLELTTEFLVVAATLLQLKARALLPSAQDEPLPEEDEERDLLIARLLEVKTFQAAGDHVAENLADGDRRYGGSPPSDDDALRALPTLAGIDAGDLAKALVEMARELRKTVDVSLLVSDQVSTEEAVSEIVSRLSEGSVTFASLARGRSLPWAVALFLAILELSMRGEVMLGQAERLGDINIELVTGGPRR